MKLAVFLVAATAVALAAAKGNENLGPVIGIDLGTTYSW